MRAGTAAAGWALPDRSVFFWRLRGSEGGFNHNCGWARESWRKELRAFMAPAAAGGTRSLQKSGLHRWGPGLQTRARPCPVASATSHRLGPGPMNPSSSEPAIPRVPSVPGSRRSQAPCRLPPRRFSFLRPTRRGHLPRKRKSFQEVCTY